MDTNLVLFWFVVLFSAAQLRFAIQAARAGLPSMLIVLLLVLGVGAGAAWVDFGTAGYWSAGVFGLLLLLPGLVQRRLRNLANAQRYADALPYARVLGLLHPSRRLRRQPALYAALAHARRGDLAAAEAQLSQLAAGARPSDALEAQLHLCRLRGDWRTYLELSEGISERALRGDLSLLYGRLRALGECGELTRMLATYTQHRALLEPANMLLVRAQALLIVMAFCGQRAATEQLLEHFFPSMSASGRAGWRAICASAAGAPEAEAQLEALARSDDVEAARGATQRLLERPHPAAAALSTEHEARLASLAQGIAHEAEYRRIQSFKDARLVQLLIALNLTAFVAELLLGGSEDILVLERMGALVSGVLTLEQSPRLVTALFLHFGALHLASNMLGLLVIGPFVEATLGKLRTLFVYLCAGVAGSLLEALLPRHDAQVFLGASGCILGLLGASAAVLLFDYRKLGGQAARSRLGRIGLVLVLQLGFDLTVPNISLYAHWSGVVVGFLMGLGLTHGTGQKPPGNAQTCAEAPSR